ncbi:MAG: hypothetical protein HRT38_20950 [Alteromonadaceae bacterium]|nr:hypothetical protein [Alteromonadaceae bacterium]
MRNVSYNYLADLAPAEQFNQNNRQNDYQQSSHILGIDINYDLSPRWSIGDKYARRTGEIRQGRETGEWFESTANLYIGRVDWHIVRHWDAIIEARLLESSQAKVFSPQYNDK